MAFSRRFSWSKNLVDQIYFFFEGLCYSLEDTIIQEKLYMFWNAKNQPSCFLLVPFLVTIIGAKIKDRSMETMKDMINKLVPEMLLGEQDGNEERQSYLNMNHS